MVALVVADLLEVHRAPLEVAQLVVEIAVHRTRVHHRHARGLERGLVVRLGFVEEVHAQLHGDARVVDHALHPLGVAVRGQPLPRVPEVAIVVVEAHGQAFDDGGRQLGGVGLPLLAGVVLDERLIQRATDQLDALVVEVLRISAGQLARLLGDELLRLGRRVVRVEELVDSAQVDRQRVDLAIVRGVHAVHIVGEARKAVHVVPHTLVGGMEQMSAVLVDLRARLLIDIRVCVAADVVAHVDDVHASAGVLHRLLRHRQAKQACANDNEIGILGGFGIVRCTGHSKQPFTGHVHFPENPCYPKARKQPTKPKMHITTCQPKMKALIQYSATQRLHRIS